MNRTKTVRKWLIIGFLAYAIVKSPDQAASILVTLGNIVVEAFKGIGALYDAILNRT